MKCRTLISISIALLMLSFETAVIAQNFHFYTETGKLRNLQLQNSEITVKLSSPFETFGGMFLAEEALDNSFAPEILSDGFYRLKVKSGYDPITLVDRLRGREDVLYANLSFLDPLGSPIYLTESLVANFYPTTSQAQIDSMNSAHSVIIVDSLFNDPYCLILRLTDNSDMDVLAMGNAYHESDLVQFARAGVIIGLTLMADPNDPYWQYQWNFKNTGQTGGTPGISISTSPMSITRFPRVQ